MIELGDFRKNEGAEWPKEQPSLLTQALSLIQDRMTLDALASEMTINTSELRALLRDCVPQELLQSMSQRSEDEPGKIVSFRQPNPTGNK